ncbi:uncharacterized protein LOC142765140 [Rhipicephalus microplus]|uniref:uncharacterized protein LOC142765140 n=1 Tax=Rhipicephalus microplus TaxID=6941 RepID=UPI003F6AAF66
MNNGNLALEKVVLFTANECSVQAKVSVQATVVKNVQVSSTAMAQELLAEADSLIRCKGFGEKGEFAANPKRQEKTCGGKTFSMSCPGVAQELGKACPQCRYLKKLLLNQASYKRRKVHACTRPLSYKLKIRSMQLKRTKSKILRVKLNIEKLKRKNASKDSSVFVDAIKSLPSKQQQQVRACLAAAKRKSTKGMKYDSEWVLECAVMCMKSPRLYEHIRKHKIMVLPSRTCLRRYLKKFRSGFGLSSKVFAAVKEKTKSMDPFQCHGGLLIDEMKLSENLSLASDGSIEGFVDLGKFTPEAERSLTCDHGLVVMFQPFSGKWHQIIGVFASHSNVKAETLAKIILECVILCENAGLHVDFVTCDGASWNRAMWHSFGVVGTKEKTVCRRKHPSDPERFLCFVSDFPHLVKCVRNSFVSTGFELPEGHADVDGIDCARNSDESRSTTLKAMPHVSKSVVRPTGFEAMRVNYAFLLFSDEVLRGLFLYREDIEEKHGDQSPTVNFVERMRNLIEAMTSRCSSGALRPGNAHKACIESFLAYLDLREKKCEKKSEKKGQIILKAAGLPISDRTSSDQIRVNSINHTVLISTPDLDRADLYHGIRLLNFNGTPHEVATHVADPVDTCRGTVLLPSDYSEDEIISTLRRCNPKLTIGGARRLGSTETILIIFQGKIVPYYVHYDGCALRCRPFRQKVEACTRCRQIGHRQDVCTNTSDTLCPKCGLKDAPMDHECDHIQEYATQLACQQWGQVCDSMQGNLDSKRTWRIDELLDIGNLCEAREVLSGCGLDHTDMVVEASDSRLIYYIGGYVARKNIATTKCTDCCAQLLRQNNGSLPAAACLTNVVNRGGLLHPSAKLNDLVTSLENAFTRCFSIKEIKSDSILDLISFLQLAKLTVVGCPNHNTELTNKVIKFYVLTRLNFLVKTQNASQGDNVRR